MKTRVHPKLSYRVNEGSEALQKGGESNGQWGYMKIRVHPKLGYRANEGLVGFCYIGIKGDRGRGRGWRAQGTCTDKILPSKSPTLALPHGPASPAYLPVTLILTWPHAAPLHQPAPPLASPAPCPASPLCSCVTPHAHLCVNGVHVMQREV